MADLHLVENTQEPESLGSLVIRSTVSLVVARAAIRNDRSWLLRQARICRDLLGSVEEEFPDAQDRRLATGIFYGKQLAYREAARILRGKDRTRNG